MIYFLVIYAVKYNNDIIVLLIIKKIYFIQTDHKKNKIFFFLITKIVKYIYNNICNRKI